MNSEAQIIISFIFRRSGKINLKKSEIYLPLSLELSWFTANEAKQFVDYVIQKKLLLKNKGLLSPSFNLENITIPIGFSPSKKEYKLEKEDVKKVENLTDTIVRCISNDTDKKSEDIYSEIKQIKSEKNIVSEVAVLLVAQRYNIDISKYFNEIESLIFTGNEE